MYFLYRNIVNFQQTSQIHYCLKNMPFKPMPTKNSQNLLFPLGHVDSHLRHPYLNQPHSPPGAAERKKIVGGLKGSDGETRIRVEGGVLLGGESSQKL